MMSVRQFRQGLGAAAAAVVLSLLTVAPVAADHATPGEAGQTKVNIYDNTHNTWNVDTLDPVTGGPDPEIGFVNFRPTTPGDPTHIVVVVSLKGAAPSCDYNIELVTTGANTSAGLAPDGFHTGSISVIGTMSTNNQGNGNSGEIMLDVTALPGFPFVAPSGQFTYAHVDVEDYNGDCTEADGTPVVSNEYGGSGKLPFAPQNLPVNIHWMQP